jgi:hypothetical protein
VKTDNVPAHTLEEGDYITNGDDIFLVREVDDAETLHITHEDEDGWLQTVAYDPFEEVTLYLGEDDVEFEEVDPDA